MPNSWKKHDNSLSTKKQRGGHAKTCRCPVGQSSCPMCSAGSCGKSLAASKGTNKGSTYSCSATFLLHQELGGVF